MTRRRLALLLTAFFLALALPTSILVYQAYGQLKWEAFHQHQQLARELTLRIDAGFAELIEREENRPISDYEFLNVTGTGGSGFLQRSPLSEFPQNSGVPGLLGYFQVDAAGQLHTPIVPTEKAANYGISARELKQRELQEGRIRGILDQNRLVGKSDLAAAAAPAEAIPEAAAMERQSVGSPGLFSEMDSSSTAAGADYRDTQGQEAFDELASRRQAAPQRSDFPVDQVKDLKLEDSYQVAADAKPEAQVARAKKQNEPKRSRKEKVSLPSAVLEQIVSLEKNLDADDTLEMEEEAPVTRQAVRIQTFESEVEAMEFALLDSGHFVLFRRIWHEDARFVQGLLIDQTRFFERLIEPAFRQSALSSMSKLIVAYQGAILKNLAADYSRLYRPSAADGGDELLYQGRLVAPFGDIELIYTLASFPLGAGGKIIVWSALILGVVLIGGFILLYRLGLRQLALARQQQDFVSAVSHELKTPLTSIRMYGEILREGWADSEKRKTYYDFIFHEAERLTRLINNVLQLARLSRNEQQASLGPVTVAEALAELKPRLRSQLEPSGFELDIGGDEAAGEACIRVDPDWFIQIFINLVDNAVKFSANAETRRIEIRYRQTRDRGIQFSVRDFGPGIAADQMKKIFKLFYRSENELTRETVGTGIGLALVRQLAGAMRAEVDVVNCDPGAEFRIHFPEK